MAPPASVPYSLLGSSNSGARHAAGGSRQTARSTAVQLVAILQGNPGEQPRALPVAGVGGSVILPIGRQRARRDPELGTRQRSARRLRRAPSKAAASRLHMGGDRRLNSSFKSPFICFNPRLRTGGDPVRAGKQGRRVAVSIHASAREATVGRPQAFHSGRKLVSIHASAREATARSAISLAMSPCFNPRLRTGGDARPKPRLMRVGQRFQSTPPHGRRPDAPGPGPAAGCFNPRLRTGGDARGRCHARSGRGFNPRLRTGGDPSRGPVRLPEPVSIHASAREATREMVEYRRTDSRGFNPRLRTGGDPRATHAAKS